MLSASLNKTFLSLSLCLTTELCSSPSIYPDWSRTNASHCQRLSGSRRSSPSTWEPDGGYPSHWYKICLATLRGDKAPLGTSSIWCITLSSLIQIHKSSKANYCVIQVILICSPIEMALMVKYQSSKADLIDRTIIPNI